MKLRAYDRNDEFRRLTKAEPAMLPDYLEHWAEDGTLQCMNCGWTWPTGPDFLPFCPNCGGEGDDDQRPTPPPPLPPRPVRR